MVLEALLELNYMSLAILILTLFLLWKTFKKPSRLPPGPRALPIIGNILDLDIKDMIGTYDKMREKYGDIFSIRIGNYLTVVISGYDNIKEAMITNGDMFPDRPPNYLFEKITHGLGILGTNGSLWKEQRMFALQTLKEFGFGKRSMEGRIMEEVRIFLETLEDTAGEAYDARYLAKVSISNLISSLVFGNTRDHKDKEAKESIDSLEKNFNLLALAAPLNFIPILRYIPGDPFKLKTIMKNSNDSGDRTLKTIQEHKDTFDENNIRDFIDAYLKELKRRGETNHYFSERQLAVIISDLFAAGTESTSETIIWAILYLVHNPKIQEKIKSEMDEVIGTSRFPSMDDKPKLPYCEAVMNEVLRISDLSPYASPRTASHDVTLKGYVIPKGTTVLPSTHSIMRDPKIFKNPEKFDPNRFLDENGACCATKEWFLPFGLGKRKCIGERLARMELFLFVTSIVQRFTLLPEKNKPLPSLEGVFRVTRTAKPFKFCAIKRH